MTIDDIIDFVTRLDGVLAIRPGPDDGSPAPEIAWGDTFFYYSPDGVVPHATQPFATIVTKDYPDDATSRLDSHPDAFRVNIAAGKDAFANRTGRAPREPAAEDEPGPSATDAVIAHPAYGSVGWLAVVNPGPRTDATVRELLRVAHHVARSRYERRTDSTTA
ncbi:DUF6194 family protein [Streptomyces apocyni]|uniref:DUF6194 family protein n=1 Tax=Streptomyces apocyni TaxID=2654677 RepID=UPI0012EAD66F|nr:DUF6194 family protein [Streptomyces apocyni]